MFFPHYAEIEIERREPSGSIELLEKVSKERISLMAERIVLKNSMQKKKTITTKTKHKIKKLNEFDEIKKSLEGFLVMWNEWREFYLDAGPMRIKTKSQATVIENVMKFVKDNKLDLYIFIGTIHKAFEKRRVNPPFQFAMGDIALENYERLYEDVMSDLDKRKYQDEALG